MMKEEKKKGKKERIEEGRQAIWEAGTKEGREEGEEGGLKLRWEEERKGREN